MPEELQYKLSYVSSSTGTSVDNVFQPEPWISKRSPDQSQLLFELVYPGQIDKILITTHSEFVPEEIVAYGSNSPDKKTGSYKKLGARSCGPISSFTGTEPLVIFAHFNCRWLLIECSPAIPHEKNPDLKVGIRSVVILGTELNTRNISPPPAPVVKLAPETRGSPRSRPRNEDSYSSARYREDDLSDPIQYPAAGAQFCGFCGNAIRSGNHSYCTSCGQSTQS